MAKAKPAPQPVQAPPTGGLPSPTLELPELDGLLKGGQPGESGMMAGSIGSHMGAMPPEMPDMSSMMGPQQDETGVGSPDAGMPQLPPGMENSPQAAIAKKLGQNAQPKNPEGQAINLIVGSIKSLNNLADLLSVSDEANSRAVRQMIRVLGEILKSAQHGQMPSSIPEM
jgi:hypothetical protein